MRTVNEQASVRLYHLDPESGGATTLMYGTLAEALREAAAQDEMTQAELWIQTANDVVAYRDLIDG